MLYTSDEQEEKLIRDYIFLPLLRQVIVRDIHLLSQLKLPQPYLKQAEIMLTNIHRDLCMVKSKMAVQGVKVYEASRDAYGISYDIIIRGYEENIYFETARLKQITEDYLTHYMHAHLK